ncbi:MAG: hypothetical protein HRT88_17960 [Lentisphaeraceae bacterium]|nr:hypothetical protein [Lentisphaeraceae bacterium]
MKKKISAIVLAVGIAAASVSAQARVQTLQNSQGTADSADAPHSIKKRLANTLRRLNRKKAENEHIRELEADITQALTSDISQTITEVSSISLAQNPIIVHHETMPVIGIDISKQFNRIRRVETVETALPPILDNQLNTSLIETRNNTLAALSN